MNFLDDIEQMFDQVQKELPKMSKEIAESLLIDLKSTIRAGFGVSSDTDANPSKNTLKPLSDSYKKKRAKMGLSTKSNLTLSGDMINDITYEIRDDQIRFYFKSAESDQKAVWNSESRPFFNFTPQQMDKAHKTLDVLIQRFLDSKVSNSSRVI